MKGTTLPAAPFLLVLCLLAAGCTSQTETEIVPVVTTTPAPLPTPAPTTAMTAAATPVVIEGTVITLSSIRLVGNVYAFSGDMASIEAVNFSIERVPGSEGTVDLSEAVICIENASGRMELERNTVTGSAASPGQWSVIYTFPGYGQSDWLLERKEDIGIMVMPAEPIQEGDIFIIEIMTPDGEPLKITLTPPADINSRIFIIH